MTAKVASPHDGGCWYCYTIDDNLVFSCEFDTYIHLECLVRTLEDDPNDREAQIMKKEFNL